MRERDLGNHSGVDNPFYDQIPHLAEQALKGRPDKAARAKKELIAGVAKDPYYDSTLVGFENIQRLLATEQNPTALRNGIIFMYEFTQAASESVSQVESKELRYTPQTVYTSARIISNDAVVQKSRSLGDFIQQVVPKGYGQFLQIAKSMTVPDLKVGLQIRTQSAKLSEADRLKQVREQLLLVDWYNAVLGILIADESLTTQKRDRFIDILKVEPKVETFPRERLVKRKIAGLSIEDIDKITYPPSDQELNKITDYLAGIMSSPMAKRDRDIIEELFFGSSFFRKDPHGAVEYKNFNLVANINLWQENFIQQLILDRDPRKENQIRTILQGISERAAGFLIYNVVQFVTHPLEHDPKFSGTNVYERTAYHLFFNQAIEEYRDSNPGETFVYGDKVGTSFLQTLVLPLLQQRLSYFGISGKFANVIGLVEKELEERPFSEIQFDTLREYFENQCGKEFLSKLNHHSDDIRAITQSVWQSVIAGGLHYLPMQEGFNHIEFSEGSVANILGLQAIMLNTEGTPRQWEENVIFRIPGSFIAINGKIDQDGKLKIESPLEERIPGLYIMLNHIAVLIFHDLVIQQQKANGEQHQKKGGNNTSDKHPDIRPKDKTHVASLPRTQTDSELISDVYIKIKQTPRRVELHKRRLSGNDDYRVAISLYQEAKGDYELTAAISELAWARSRSKKASEAKVRNLPARFQLESVLDPVTGEVRYIETWVVEHTSPKPTEEELASPVRLYERYYRHSSALASLDQLKPWFVGE